MLSVEEALEQVRRALGTPGVVRERVPLAAALGRVLAADVCMDHPVPPFRRATMDGYALAGEAQVGRTYRVVGRVLAGEVSTQQTGPGEALRVMTGAALPEGSVCVVPFEWTEDVADERMRVLRRPGVEPHIVEVGAHCRQGAVVLAAGSVLRPGGVGVLATAGVAEVEVARRPRVAVLASGSELVAVAARPGPAQIRNSNNPTLLAQVVLAGAEPVDLGSVGDEPGPLEHALCRGLEHDVLLVSGGVSRGDLDLVPGVLRAAGVSEIFHGWAVQPGGPLWFGVRGLTLVFALPGNPAASFVGFELLVWPALRARLGQAFRARETLTAAWAGAAPGPYPRRRIRPVTLSSDVEGGLWATPRVWQGSGDPFALAEAGGLALLPEAGLPEDGSGGVPVILLDGAR